MKNQNGFTLVCILIGIAKDHNLCLVQSSTCLVILDYFHFTPLVLIGKKLFFLKLEARLEAVIFSYSLKFSLVAENFKINGLPCEQLA